LPLSRAEIGEKKPTFLQKAMAGKVAKTTEYLIGDDLIDAVFTGGYQRWFNEEIDNGAERGLAVNVNAIVQRDVRDIAELEKMDQMPRAYLKFLLTTPVNWLNFTQIGGQIGLDDKTTTKYVAVLEQLFLVRRLEPWFRNRLKRLVKTPKLHSLDSGLLAAILGTTEERIGKDRSVFGQLLETFAFAEVMKQVDWLAETCRLYHLPR
jgi:uncharacterized protein